MSSSVIGTFIILSFSADHLLFGSLKSFRKIMFFAINTLLSSDKSSSQGMFSIVNPFFYRKWRYLLFVHQPAITIQAYVLFVIHEYFSLCHCLIEARAFGI